MLLDLEAAFDLQFCRSACGVTSVTELDCVSSIQSMRDGTLTSTPRFDHLYVVALARAKHQPMLTKTHRLAGSDSVVTCSTVSDCQWAGVAELR